MAKKELINRWDYPFKKLKEEVGVLVKETKLTELQVAVLYNRGFRTKEEIKKHLYSSVLDMHDTRLMKGAKEAAEAIIEATKKEKNIVNYSDYDADGVGSAVTITTLLRRVGAKINVWTNTRSIGYGISPKGIDKMLEKYPETDLVITTDNGIVSFEAADYLKKLGIDLIITDHHEPADNGKVPEAIAVVDPKQDGCNYPFKELCGAGIALKLAMLVYHEMGKDPNECLDLIDIVTLSTVADVVPIVNENRIIVKEGLKKINAEEKLVWKLFREVFSDNFNDLSEIDSETIGFMYGPSVNACSRMLGSVEKPINLFIEAHGPRKNDEEFLRPLVEELYSINLERKAITKEQTDGGLALWEDKDDLPVIVVNHEDFQEGIVGIVAGRLKDQYNRPTFVLAEDPHDPNVLRGSGRSIDNFSLKKALDEIHSEDDSILIKYGGHAMAAGVSIHKDKLIDFQMSLVLKAEESLSPEDFYRKILIDYAINANTISGKLYDEIKALQPYGQGFTKPILGIKGVEINVPTRELKYLGQEKNHLIIQTPRLKVTSWFGADYYKLIGEPKKFSLVGTLDGIDKYTRLPVFNLDKPQDLKIEK